MRPLERYSYGTYGSDYRDDKGRGHAVLKKSFDACDAANASVTEANALEISGGGFMRGSKVGTIQKNVVHDNELYGQMVVYMRMKGIVPSSTAMRNRM